MLQHLVITFSDALSFKIVSLFLLAHHRIISDNSQFKASHLVKKISCATVSSTVQLQLYAYHYTK